MNHFSVPKTDRPGTEPVESKEAAALSSTEMVGIMLEPMRGKISCEILSRSRSGGVSMEET